MGEDEVEIKWTQVKTPVEIVVGGKTYPNTKWNHDIVREYWESNDPQVLSKLKDFSLEF